MKKTMTIALILIALALTSCDSPIDGETPPPPAPTVQTVEVKTAPGRTAYGLNSTDFDFTGMVLTVTYSDGTVQDITYTPADDALYSVSGFNRSAITSGTPKTANITYNGVPLDNTINGLGVYNIVAERGTSIYTYHGYDTLTAALPGSGGEQGQTATITLYDDQICSDRIFVASGGTITLASCDSSEKTITSNFTDKSLFSIAGTLTLKDGIKITGHTYASANAYSGGAVYVNSRGKFIMDGGTISNNEVKSTSKALGGGVHVGFGGAFTMNDGTISGNKVTGTGSGSALGGGVYVDYNNDGGSYKNGTFTYNSGTISGNSTSTSSGSAQGGRVYVKNGGTCSGLGTATNSDSSGSWWG